MNTEAKDFFPQGLALGENFCNRVLERTQLKDNIDSVRATLITSPRRYGKTSVVLYVLSGLKMPFAYIDLYAELNEMEVQNSVLSAIGDVLYSIESGAKKSFKFVTDFFADLNVNFKFSGEKIQIEFSRGRKPPAKVMLDALKKLDNALKARNKKAVLFLDEFQRISQITESQAIEASIRHIAQESKNIVFIFSGSNRNLLSTLFDDRTKPLYKLCDKIILERIKSDDYIPFILNKFSQKWGGNVRIEIIQSILDITENHPYYVNVLCHKLFLSQEVPTEKHVEMVWHKYAMAEKNNVTYEIDMLSINQSKMLVAIAKYGSEMIPLSKEFIAITRFPVSSAFQAIKALEKKDYIQIKENGMYLVVDPLIKYIFSGKNFYG